MNSAHSENDTLYPEDHVRRKLSTRPAGRSREPLLHGPSPRSVFMTAMVFAAALSTLSVAACSRAQLEQQRATTGAEFILEIFNPQPRAMNVMFTMGGATTTLGRVAASETRRWAIPNQGGDEIRLVANDSTSRQTITKTLDLDKGKVVRWEIRE